MPLPKSSVRAAIVCAAILIVSSADAAVRVMTYNIAADIDRDGNGSYNAADGTANAANVRQVVQAVTRYTLAGNAQAPDVLSLQELYSTNANPAATLTAVVNELNTAFAASGVTYAFNATGLTNAAGAQGNGPNGLIYRTQTIQVLSAANIGTASSAGAPRTPVRYQLRATGTTGANTFYLYNEHTKASSGQENADRRSIETASVRADADAIASNDPNAHFVYTGDFNFSGLGSNADVRLDTGGSNEQSYLNLTNAGGGGRAFDPLVGSFQNYTAGQVKYYTEASDSLSRRYDLQLVSGNVLPTNFAAGLQLVPGTYTSFGGSYYAADGTIQSAVALRGRIDTAANASATGIPLTDLQNLIATSDHLPVVADYVIAVPEPGMLAVVCIGAGVLRRRRGA